MEVDGDGNGKEMRENEVLECWGMEFRPRVRLGLCFGVLETLNRAPKP